MSKENLKESKEPLSEGLSSPESKSTITPNQSPPDTSPTGEPTSNEPSTKIDVWGLINTRVNNLTNEMNDISDTAALIREQIKGLRYKLEKLYDQVAEWEREGLE